MRSRHFYAAAITIFACVMSAVAQSDDVFKKKFIKDRMLKVADWQLKNPKHPPYDWDQRGVLRRGFRGI